MCKTRWVERHEAYEVFFALFSFIMRAFERMANERLFAGQYGDAAWSCRDTDTNTATPRIKRVDLRTPFQVFLYNHLVDGNEMPFRPETPKCKTSEERCRYLATRRTLTVIMSRTIPRTSETTSKTTRPSGSIWLSLPRRMQALYLPSRARPISSSIATMYQHRHRLITIRGQLLFPF